MRASRSASSCFRRRRTRAQHDAVRHLEKPPGREALAPRIRFDDVASDIACVVGVLLREHLAEAALAIQIREVARPRSRSCPFRRNRGGVSSTLSSAPARFDDARLHPLAERSELRRTVRKRSDGPQPRDSEIAHRAERRLVGVRRADALDSEEHGLAGSSFVWTQTAVAPKSSARVLRSTSSSYMRRALAAGERGEEHLHRRPFGDAEAPRRRPREHRRAGLVGRCVRIVDDAQRARGRAVRRGSRPPSHTAACPSVGASASSVSPTLRERFGQRHRGGERPDHAHVRELVVRLVEPADFGGRQLPDPLGRAARSRGRADDRLP